MELRNISISAKTKFIGCEIIYLAAGEKLEIELEDKVPAGKRWTVNAQIVIKEEDE